MPYRQTTTDAQTHAVNLRVRYDIRILILEKSFRPRKARKVSKDYQAVGRYPKGELLNQYNVLFCLVSFVFFVDKLRFLGN